MLFAGTVYTSMPVAERVDFGDRRTGAVLLTDPINAVYCNCSTVIMRNVLVHIIHLKDLQANENKYPMLDHAVQVLQCIINKPSRHMKTCNSSDVRISKSTRVLP